MKRTRNQTRQRASSTHTHPPLRHPVSDCGHVPFRLTPGQRATGSGTGVRLAWLRPGRHGITLQSVTTSLKKKTTKRKERKKAHVKTWAGAHLPILCTTQSCWHSGQRLFCFTHRDMQQLWKEWLHSPQTTGDTEGRESDRGKHVGRQVTFHDVLRSNHSALLHRHY